MTVVYEDNHIIIVNKTASEIVQGDKTGDTPLSETVKQYLKEKYSKPGNVFIGVTHRLDRPVSGLVVFAKTSKALSRLNEMFKNSEVKKTYWAVVKNLPREEEGELVNYLVRNEKQNKSYAYDKEVPGSKKAILHYRLIGRSQNYYLLEIDLKTGRHHQIRVQMAYHGTPLYGDMKYGVPVGTAKLDKKENADQGTMTAAGNRNMPGIRTAGNMGSGRESIALCASSLIFFHPVTKKEMTFEIEPVGGAFQLFQV